MHGEFMSKVSLKTLFAIEVKHVFTYYLNTELPNSLYSSWTIITFEFCLSAYYLYIFMLLWGTHWFLPFANLKIIFINTSWRSKYRYNLQFFLLNANKHYRTISQIFSNLRIIITNTLSCNNLLIVTIPPT